MTTFAPFDAADYLDDEATIAAYISAALEDPNPDVFLTAMCDVARARGVPNPPKAPDGAMKSRKHHLRPHAFSPKDGLARRVLVTIDPACIA